MKARDLRALGIPDGEPMRLALEALPKAARELNRTQLEERLRAILENPVRHEGDPYFGQLAVNLQVTPAVIEPRPEPVTWKQWGQDLDPPAIGQMVNACRLPVSVAGALMPDAHVGYGLPIGGVLATENAVIPYAVGVDIACRMRITVLDVDADAITADQARLIRVLERETRFGVGATFKKPREHDVMDRDWTITPVTQSVRERAQGQLGTSGSGNHFVEFGILKLSHPDLGLEPGKYLALLSHSGSRGPGALVADHYSKLAQRLNPGLPQELRHLAWLDLSTAEGQEYWAAMELMGHFAAANHEVIHREIVRALHSRALACVENHHNFAWKEKHFGRELIVHRKGATPASRGVLGVIPGSMASPAYVVRGLGQPESLNSASHGAGRVMSRTQALKTFKWKDVKSLLDRAGVTLLSSGLDEVPMVYKDINQVMQDQQDLVDIVAQFNPKIVKMAPAGERPED